MNFKETVLLLGMSMVVSATSIAQDEGGSQCRS